MSKIMPSQKRCSRWWLFWDTAPPGYTYVKVASFFHISFCGCSPFLEYFSPKSPWANSPCLGSSGHPEREKYKIFFQTVREPLGISCYSSPERWSHSVTDTGLGVIVSLITGESRHLSCFTLWGFSLKEPLLLIHHCQKYHSFFFFFNIFLGV